MRKRKRDGESKKSGSTTKITNLFADFNIHKFSPFSVAHVDAKEELE